MRWNKEKLICAGAIVVFVFVATRSVTIVGESSVDPAGLQLSSPPQAPVTSVSGGAALGYYSLELKANPRDPFIEVSSWRPAAPDELNAPQPPKLSRRVPLPVSVSRATRALPIREEIPPVVSESSEGGGS